MEQQKNSLYKYFVISCLGTMAIVLLLLSLRCGTYTIYKDPAEPAILLNDNSNYESVYSMDQGAYQLAIQVLLALDTPDEKMPIVNSMPGYGFITRNSSENNEYALPIGMTTKSVGGITYTSMNCSVCHTGKIRVDGQAYIIDGIPNLFHTMEWAKHVNTSINLTLTNPARLMKFVKRILNRKVIKITDLKNTSEQDLDQAIETINELTDELAQINKAGRLHERFPTTSSDGSITEAEFAPFKDHSIAHTKARFVKALLQIEKANKKGQVDHLKLFQKEAKKEIEFINKTYKITPSLKNQIFPSQASLFPLPDEQTVMFISLEPEDNSFDHTVERLGTTLSDAIHMAKHQLKYGNNILSIVDKMGLFAPGTDDAWTILSDLVVNEGNLTTGPIPTITLDQAPVKIPSLFAYSHYKNSVYYKSGQYAFHCDGNTNTMVQRNLLQAMAIGASNTKKGAEKNVTMVKIDKLIEAEKYYSDVKIPKFKEIFPDHFDKKLAKKGEKLFKRRSFNIPQPDGSKKQETCFSCHYQKPQGREIPIDWVNTNRKRWAFYHANPKNNDYLQKLGQKARDYTKASALDQGVPLDNEFLKNDTWHLRRSGYIARPLHGIWVSAPYLHNGSVRTIRQLLTKPDDRENLFYTGTRNYDIQNLGYKSEEYFYPNNIKSEKHKVKAFAREVGKLKPTIHLQNKTKENIGHTFGTDWSPAEKDAIIEYIKSL